MMWTRNQQNVVISSYKWKSFQQLLYHIYLPHDDVCQVVYQFWKLLTHYFIKRTFVHPSIRLLKVARYSFLKSRKHTLQIQNLVHWYFARRMFCLVYNNFLRIKNCNENVHNCSCYGNNENSNWLLICV